MSEIKKILSPVAPTIAAAIGTPVGGVGAAMLTNALGIPSTLTEEEVKKLIENASDNDIAKIKHADSTLALHIESIRHENGEGRRGTPIQRDRFSSRARPLFLYLFYFIILAIVILVPALGVFFPHQIYLFYEHAKSGFGVIPTELWGVFCAGYLGYAGVRTYEKSKGVSK